MAKRTRADITDADLIGAAANTHRYAPYGAARDLFHTRDSEVLLAGPARTGKSQANLEKMHLCMSKYPNARAFIARKTRASMTNSCLEMFDNKILKPIDRVKFHKTDQVYLYPNGSKLAVVGLDNPGRILSTEWDMGYVQEVTECTENDWEICTTRLSSGVMPYQQMLADCNPDRPTHWMKKRADAGKTKLMQSFHKDNPRLFNQRTQEWTTFGLEYLKKLENLSGVRYNRLFKGLWVSAEGAVYDKWDQLVHMVSLNDLTKSNPDWPSWPHYWAMDWGFVHPCCWQDWIENPRTGQLYRLREIYHTGVLVEDLARQIVDLTKSSYVPRAIICDHDLEDRKVFERHTGLLTLPAYKSILVGIQAVQRRLDPNWCSEGPGIMYVRDALIHQDRTLATEMKPTCTEEEYEGYVWDEKNNEKENSRLDELPIDRDNHGLDPSRYMVAFADNLSIDPEEEVEDIVFGTDGDEVRISPY